MYTFQAFYNAHRSFDSSLTDKNLVEKEKLFTLSFKFFLESFSNNK